MGDRILVSGTGPVEPDGSTTPGDAAAQAERVFAIITDAVHALGGRAVDVVRTRMFLTDPADALAVGTVHARHFAGSPPVATMLVVTALLRAEWRVEVEAEAVLGS